MKILTPEQQRQVRLNQPRLTRVEALRQMQATVKLEPHALEELRRSNTGLQKGPKKAAG
jgi:hypothetical protein